MILEPAWTVVSVIAVLFTVIGLPLSLYWRVQDRGIAEQRIKHAEKRGDFFGRFFVQERWIRTIILGVPNGGDPRRRAISDLSISVSRQLKLGQQLFPRSSTLWNVMDKCLINLMNSLDHSEDDQILALRALRSVISKALEIKA